MTYIFASPDNSLVQRSDGVFISWAGSHPTDTQGGAYTQWVKDGSPVPDPYSAPPPTDDQVRSTQFNSDTDRQTIVTNLQNKTPDQIKQWINNNAVDLPTTKQMLIRLTLLVAKTLRD